MKTFFKISVIALFLNASMVFANVNLPVEDFPKAMKEITQYLNDFDVNEEKVFEDFKSVRISFTISSDSEIVVLDIRTKNQELKNYIKLKLDRKQLESGDLIPGKYYCFNALFK